MPPSQPRRLVPLLALCAALALPAMAQQGPASPGPDTPATTPASAEQPAEAPHAAWSALLARYVRPGADGLNRFDYAALKASDTDRAALRTYIDSFAALDFSALDRDAAFAAWANLYNALTIDHIIGRYPVGSIRDGYLVGPWKSVKTMAGGREVSLDEIEHAILRTQWDDPRVHYAVNCASVGCPNLGTRAWTADTLEADLDAAARAYINDPRGVTLRTDGNLRVSRIYKWFREDFGGTDTGVLAHLARYADADLKAALDGGARIRGHAYDWSLNDTEGGNS